MWPACAGPIPVEPLAGVTEPFSAASHLLPIAVFAALAPRLWRRAQGYRGRPAAIGLFVFAVLFMFSMSTLYHLMPHGSDARGVMLRMDHAGIFMLIASTVTVVHTVLFRGVWRWAPIAFFWLVVASMVPLKAVFLRDLSEWVNTGVYIGLGIPGFVVLGVLLRRLGWRTCAPFLAGGVIYIVGALFNQLFWPNLIPGVMHAHELFHLFVIAGVACHWRFAWLILAEEPVGAAVESAAAPAPATVAAAAAR